MSQHQGFSLLELLLSMSIGLVVIMVIGKAFINFNKIYKVESSVAQMQENARFSVHMIRGLSASAGMVGSARMAFYLPIKNQGVSALNQIDINNYFTVYHGANNIWQPPLPQIFKIKPKNNTDVIAIKCMAPITANLVQNLNESNKIYVSLAPDFYKNDDIVISDCLHVVLARIKSVRRSIIKQRQILTTTQIIHDKFDLNAEVGKIQTNVFYVKSTGRKNIHGETIYALYYVNANGRKDELIPNIIGLKISDVIKNKIIKVKLLLTSEDNALLKPKNFQFFIRLFNHE